MGNSGLTTPLHLDTANFIPAAPSANAASSATSSDTIWSKVANTASSSSAIILATPARLAQVKGSVIFILLPTTSLAQVEVTAAPGQIVAPSQVHDAALAGEIAAPSTALPNDSAVEEADGCVGCALYGHFPVVVHVSQASQSPVPHHCDEPVPTEPRVVPDLVACSILHTHHIHHGGLAVLCYQCSAGGALAVFA